MNVPDLPRPGSKPDPGGEPGRPSGLGLGRPGARLGDPAAPVARTKWFVRDIPVVVWLTFLLVVVGTHTFLPVATWLLIHLLVLGAVTHSILVWSKHFADALLHTPTTHADVRAQSTRLITLNSGTLVVVIGMMTGVWALVVVGAAAIVVAVVWHGFDLLRQIRGSLSSRFAFSLRYYLAAASLLPIGVVAGVLLAFGMPGQWQTRLLVAHAIINLLGWIGLTVIGTLLTLWPTMLRTKIVPGAEAATRRALPILLSGLGLAIVAALLSHPWAIAIALAVYLAGLVVVLRPFIAAAIRKPPIAYATYSVAAAVSWLVISLVAAIVEFVTASSWSEASTGFSWLVPALVAGFAAQVLFGALSYLLPVVLGGGPGPVRAATAEFDRLSGFRITLINGGLIICLLPVPSWVRVLCSAFVALGLVIFLPLIFRGIRASRAAKADPPEPWSRDKQSAAEAAAKRRSLAGVAAAIVVLLLGVSGGIALDPAAGIGAKGDAAAAGVTPTGQTTTVEVTTANMRFTPATITVPAGDRLVIDVTNTDDSQVHDLVLETGQETGRLAPGESKSLDVGVVGKSLSGWCSLPGHRQMGMVFGITVTGDQAATGGSASGTDDGSMDSGSKDSGSMGHGSMDHGDSTGPSAAKDLDVMADPGPDFTARDARVPSVSDAKPGTVHKLKFTVSEVIREVSPGVKQKLWTFNGTAPGPVIHGKVGDSFDITLVNDGSIGHSIDFHAGQLAPNQPMRTIEKGESLTFSFTAEHSGMWMYHCGTMPMSLHIANGMFGAVIIDPPDLPTVDQEYFLVQSELYLGPQNGIADAAKINAGTPDAIVFNGYTNQYEHAPLTAKVGERVRIWVLDVGPSRATGFHIVGGQFDTVFKEGAYLLRPGNKEKGASQTLDLAPSQGGFVETSFTEAGDYPFVTHYMVDAEKGASGSIHVTK